MCQPLISFIIPYYNIPEELFRNCLMSVLNLELQVHEREIIIVDDGSYIPLDSSWADENNNVFIIRQENKGLSAARNSGIDKARGIYIQFIDSDDQIIAYLYNQCIAILRNEQPDILKFHYEFDDAKHNNTISFDTWQSGTDFMIHNNLETGACAYLFKRDVLDNLRFTEGIYHEDEEFTPLLFLRAKKMIVTDAKAYYYLQRPHSITKSIDSESVNKRLDDFYQIILRLKTLNETLGELSPLKRRIDQASMDYIINVIRLFAQENHCLKGVAKFRYVKRQLENNISKMRSDSLFPLPKASYTRNYSLFRFMTNRKPLRAFLCLCKF